MFGISVNVLTGEVQQVPLTGKEIAEAQARTAAEAIERAEREKQEAVEALIQQKMRERAIASLKAEGKLTAEGKLK